MLPWPALTPDSSFSIVSPARAFFLPYLKGKCQLPLCLREMGNLSKYLEEVRDLLPLVSLILIPHDIGAFDLPEALRAKSRFVGQIMKPAPAFNKAKQRNSDNRRVVVSGGGGGYPGTFRFYNLAMRAVSELQEMCPPLEAKTVVGPLFREWPQLEPVNGIPVIPFDSDPFATFASADLVISVAGYNTVTELQYVGTRTILLPAERLWDDQYARAEHMAHAHSHFRIFRGTSPTDLAKLAYKFLTETISTTPASVPDGASRAAHCLRAMIKGTSVSA